MTSPPSDNGMKAARLLLLAFDDAGIRTTGNGMKAMRTAARALDAFAAQAVAAKDNAYSERNLCVGVIARMAEKLGWPVWLGKHDGGEWDDDWRNILFIETPAGQISWHLHDSEMHYFERFPARNTPWDGHSTTEKYERALAAAGTGSTP